MGKPLTSAPEKEPPMVYRIEGKETLESIKDGGKPSGADNQISNLERGSA